MICFPFGGNVILIQVTFTGELGEDLRRRDLTINAMAYNDEAGLVDLFGGMADLEAGVVRCVGNPRERFREDALRILRAIRPSPGAPCPEWSPARSRLPHRPRNPPAGGSL